MTNQEAIKIAQGLITDFKCESEIMVDFCNVVIGALEQMGALDKIVAEIQDHINYNRKMDYKGIMAGLLVALNIVNHYKAESEDEE